MPHLTPEEIAFPKLSSDQLKLLHGYGKLEKFADGEELIRVGQRNYPFCAVVSGAVRIVDTSTGTPKDVVTHGPGNFVGDVDILTGRPAVISAVAKGDTNAYVVPASIARRLLNEIPDLSDLLMNAFQLRREMLQATNFLGTLVVGEAHDKETARIREFFYKNHVPHTFFDVQDDDGKSQLGKLDAQQGDTPVVVCNGHVAKRPHIIKIAECLGISRQLEDSYYDLIVVGAGPAGLASAVYAASEGIKTLVVDRMGPGGQAGSSSKIENFMGFPSGLSGAELANRSYLQALKFGAHFTSPVTVKSVRQNIDSDYELDLCTGQTARSRCVLAATGVSYRQLVIEGCREFEGSGVYYAATSVESRVCREATAVIVGGGNSAGQAAMYLADQAKQVKLLIRGDDLSRSMSAYLCGRVLQHDRIEVLKNTEVQSIHGHHRVERIEVRNNVTEQTQDMDCAGLFVFIGAKPHTDWLPSNVGRDDKGFVLTGSAVQSAGLWNLDRTPCDLETSMPGILAAGDVRSGTTKRCGFAVGDGSLAVTCIHRYLGQL